MIASLALLFLTGLLAAALCDRVRLPRITGLLLTGVLLGPCALNLLDEKLLGISAELRQIALIIILLKAGLSLNLSDLKKVGRPAVLMSFVPASCELIGYVLLAPALLGLNRVEAALLGAVLGAVSPAVVVPRMVRLMEEGRGTERSVPQLVMAGASCDDVFVIVLFSTFLGMAQGGQARAMDFVKIPVSILTGVALGALTGTLLARLLECMHEKGRTVRNSQKVILLLALSFLLVSAETWLKAYLPLSGLLAVVGMACAVRAKSTPAVSARLSAKFGKLWLAAEVLLFVLVGAAVDVRYTLAAGPAALAIILLALVFRSLGVLACLIKTPLTRRERLFCLIAYLPKATVQAAIGSAPLAAGLACGQTVLSVAVLSILVTAPLGALAIDRSVKRLLTKKSGKILPNPATSRKNASSNLSKTDEEV